MAVYHWVAYDLERQLNDYLLTLAEAASQTLDIVKHEHHEYEEGRDEDDDDYEQPPPKLAELSGKYGEPEFLGVPKHHPQYYAQGVEWYDEERELLIQEGNLFPSWSLSKHLERSNHQWQADGIRSFVLLVLYAPGESQAGEIAGYIRTNHSIGTLETQLERLRLGLTIGGAIALCLAGLGGMALTRESLKPIRKSFQQLKQFTADASHELRSPLTAIKSSISLLQNHPERIHEADVKKVAAIASATDQMTRLVEDLLLLARMEGTVKTITIETIEIPIDEILEDLIEALQTEAEARAITLKSKLVTDVFVLGDGKKLVRLFANLIENALQYTPAEGTVKVSLFRSNEEAIVAVEDTGIGIAPSDLNRVFDRLWRADRARSFRQEGTGLGMAIAQTIARAHGGRITVSSELGVGSCFQVYLPIFRED